MAPKKSNGFGIASLVLGILSVINPFFFLPIITGILGIVMAIKQRKIQPNAFATAGLVLSIIGLCIWGVIYLFVILILGASFGTFGMMR